MHVRRIVIFEDAYLLYCCDSEFMGACGFGTNCRFAFDVARCNAKLLSDVGLTHSYRYTMLPGVTVNDLTRNITNTNKFIDHRSYTSVSSVQLSSTPVTVSNYSYTLQHSI